MVLICGRSELWGVEDVDMKNYKNMGDVQLFFPEPLLGNRQKII